MEKIQRGDYKLIIYEPYELFRLIIYDNEINSSREVHGSYDDLFKLSLEETEKGNEVTLLEIKLETIRN